MKTKKTQAAKEVNLANGRLRIICGDALTELSKLPSESVHMCVTSPAYWGLRDYQTAKWEGGNPKCDHKNNKIHQRQGGNSQRKGRANIEAQRNENFKNVCAKCGARRVDKQLGLERTPEEYVTNLVEVFREVRRVLRSDGTFWLNSGDSYARDFAKGGSGPNGKHDFIPDYGNARKMMSESKGSSDGLVGRGDRAPIRNGAVNLKPKDLAGIPWLLALALRADGWHLRSEITWLKKSAMPESVTDRPSSATEKIFLFSKSPKYFYDHLAVRNPLAESTLSQVGQKYDGDGQKDYLLAGVQDPSDAKRRIIESLVKNGGSNLRNYWLLGPEPYSGAHGDHFATFPTEIPRRAILLGTSARGCCPKCGSPWKRIIEKGYRAPADEEVIARMVASGVPRQKANLYGNPTRNPQHYTNAPDRTIGWKSTCKCQDELDKQALKATRSGDGLVVAPELTPVPCTVIDPFFGSGTTGLVVLELGRKCIGIDLNISQSVSRCDVTPGMTLF